MFGARYFGKRYFAARYFGPGVASTTNAQPGVGSLILTGYPPSLSLSLRVAPGAGSLTLTGFAPALRTKVFPGVGALTFTGLQPSIRVDSGQAVYISASGPEPIFINASSMLVDSSVRHEGEDGTVQVIGHWPRRRQKWQVTWAPSAASTIDALFRTYGHDTPWLFVPLRLSDYQVTDQVLGTGDGVETDFQLSRSFSNGVRTVTYDIPYPLSDAAYPVRADGDTIHIYLDGTPTSAWSLDDLGIIVFDSAPGVGVVVTATFQFATLVEWVSDSINATLLQASVNEIRSAEFEEVFQFNRPFNLTSSDPLPIPSPPPGHLTGDTITDILTDDDGNLLLAS